MIDFASRAQSDGGQPVADLRHHRPAAARRHGRGAARAASCLRSAARWPISMRPFAVGAAPQARRAGAVRQAGPACGDRRHRSRARSRLRHRLLGGRAWRGSPAASSRSRADAALAATARAALAAIGATNVTVVEGALETGGQGQGTVRRHRHRRRYRGGARCAVRPAQARRAALVALDRRAGPARGRASVRALGQGDRVASRAFDARLPPLAARARRQLRLLRFTPRY